MSASSSSTAAWARRSSSSTSRSEDYGGLAGQVPRGARPQPAGRDPGRARVDDRGGRRGASRPTPSRPAPQARGVGARRAHARDQPQGRRDRAQGRRASDRFVAGSIGPTGHLPASDDPTLGKITFRELVEVFTEQAPRPGRGRRRPDHHRDRAGHPRGEGRDLRRARGVQADRPHGADPDERLAAAERRQDAARHRHPGRAHHADRARRRRDRAQLLDRPRGHARRDPLPRRDQPAAGALHPERRPAAPGPGGRDDLPRGARAARERRSRSSSSATASRIVGGCCGTTPDHIAAIVDRVGGRDARAAARRAGPALRVVA